MLFIKKENVITYYLENRQEINRWNAPDRDLLERLLRVEMGVADEQFIFKVSRMLAAINKELERGGGLVDVVHAISANSFGSDKSSTCLVKK